MTFEEYQAAAFKTAMNPTLDHLAFGLLEEAGEIAGILKRFHRGDEDYIETYNADNPELISVPSFLAYDKLESELGDVLWHLAALCEFLSIDLEDVAKANIEKLKDRMERGVIKGGGDYR